MKTTLKKRLLASLLCGAMAVSLAACGGDGGTASSGGDEASSSGEVVELQIGFENSASEPIGQGLEKWAELLDEASGGTMKITLYPDSQLGSKNELIDSMLLGEPVATLADGAFYADYGVPDFGIVFGPFLFDDWDQCWTTTTPVHTVDDLAGLKIRVPNNQIQSYGFDVLGAVSTGMDLGDVYMALQGKTIDGAENPIATLYGRKLHEVAPYLILDGHVLNFTTWVCSADWFNSLTEEQQNWLVETGEEAGVYNNQVLEEQEQEYLDQMVAEGVTVYEPTEEELNGFREKAQAFYDMGDTFGWSDGLYETVQAAMGK